MNLFENRLNPIDGLEESELEVISDILLKFFDKNWLESTGENPIQILFRRKDILATSELIGLGLAIENIDKIAPLWVKRKINIIKNNDDKNRNGALFELLGLNLFYSQLCKIIPSKNNQKGYDATLKFDNDYAIRLSMKNFNISEHNKIFLENCKCFENLLLKILNEKNINHINMLILSEKNYPEQNDWKELCKSMPNLIDKFVFKGHLKVENKNHGWEILMNNIFPKNIQLNSDFKSYQLSFLVKYHSNEKKNLTDKIEKACFNLTKNSQIKDKTTFNVLFIHLPLNLSFLDCVESAKEYFKQNSNKSISAILFYQPYFGIDPQTEKQDFFHCFSTIMNDDIENHSNFRKINLKHLNIPFGKFCFEPCEVIISDKLIKKQLSERYFYQTGHYYVHPETNKDGLINGTISKLAPGVFTHIVYKIHGNDNYNIASGHFPPDDRLLIL